MAGKIKKEVAIGVGIIGGLQVLFGLCISICCFVFAGKASDVIAPFWSGIPLLLLGCLGIAIAVTKNNCLLITYLIINIFLIIILFIAGGLTAIGAALFGLAIDYLDKYGCRSIGDNCVCMKSTYETKTYNGMDCDNLKMIHTLLQALAAFNILGALASLAGSICSCVGLCGAKEPATTVIVTQGHGQHVIVTQNGQPQQQNGYPQGIIAYQPPPGAAGQPPPPGYDEKPKQTFVHAE